MEELVNICSWSDEKPGPSPTELPQCQQLVQPLQEDARGYLSKKKDHLYEEKREREIDTWKSPSQEKKKLTYLMIFLQDFITY